MGGADTQKQHSSFCTAYPEPEPSLQVEKDGKEAGDGKFPDSFHVVKKKKGHWSNAGKLQDRLKHGKR